VLLKVIHQLLRHWRREYLVGHGRAVAGVAFHIHFVLHLDHEDRVLLAIHLFDVPHERGESVRIGVPVASLSVESSSMVLPSRTCMRGKRLKVLLHPVPGG